MKNPQTLAEKLFQQFPEKKLKSIKDYSCCVLTLMWCLGYDKDDADAIIEVAKLMNIGAIDSECTVYWKSVAFYIADKNISVDFLDCTSIKKIKERTPVRFSYNGKSHWVGVENGKIAFNSLEHSVCVEKGKPVEKRVIKYI